MALSIYLQINKIIKTETKKLNVKKSHATVPLYGSFPEKYKKPTGAICASSISRGLQPDVLYIRFYAGKWFKMVSKSSLVSQQILKNESPPFPLCMYITLKSLYEKNLV